MQEPPICIAWKTMALRHLPDQGDRPRKGEAGDRLDISVSQSGDILAVGATSQDQDGMKRCRCRTSYIAWKAMTLPPT